MITNFRESRIVLRVAELFPPQPQEGSMAIERSLSSEPFGSIHPKTSKRERETPMNLVKKFLQSEDGPTAVEYAVMLALIIVVCIGTITALGSKVNTSFSSTTTALP